MLTPGDAAPRFIAPSDVNPTFHFDSVAGRYVVLCFLGSARWPAAQRVLGAVHENNHYFDVQNRLFCGVSCDPADTQLLSNTSTFAGIRYFADFQRTIAGGHDLIEETPEGSRIKPTTFILDEGLRILAIFPVEGDGSDHLTKVSAYLAGLPDLARSTRTAPVLALDRVFEPELCRELIGIYESSGGYDSGFMREIDGKTTGILDHGFKRRTDCEITDQAVIQGIHVRLQRRVIPEIKRFSTSRTPASRRVSSPATMRISRATSTHIATTRQREQRTAPIRVRQIGPAGIVYRNDI
jgi:peroxiredoxin